MSGIDLIERAVVRCTKCPELRTYCRQVAAEKKRAYRDWTYWGKPVPAFGDPNARVMLVLVRSNIPATIIRAPRLWHRGVRTHS